MLSAVLLAVAALAQYRLEAICQEHGPKAGDASDGGSKASKSGKANAPAQSTEMASAPKDPSAVDVASAAAERSTQ